MPANSIESGTLSEKGDRTLVTFGLWPGKGDFYWYAPELEDGFGMEPGVARIVIPNRPRAVNAAGGAVAFNPDGPMKNIKHGTPCFVYRQFWTIDANNVEQINAQLLAALHVVDVEHILESKGKTGRDALEVWAMDAREELCQLRIVGRFVAMGGGATDYEIYFDLWPAHFNPGGRPNCIFDAKGRPWFAPVADYGLDEDEEPPAASTKSMSKACYWTLANILEYFRNTIGPDSPNPSTLYSQTSAWTFFKKCPSYLKWPAGLGSVLDQEAVYNFDAGVGQNNSATGGARKGRDYNANGKYFVGGVSGSGVLDEIFESAAGFSYTIQYDVASDGTPVQYLAVVPARWSSVNQGIDVPFAAGGNASSVILPGTLTSMRYRESSRNTITCVAALSNPVKLEVRMSSKAADHGGTAAFVKAWTDARETAMWTMALDLGGDEEAVLEAYKRFPEVGTQIKPNPLWDWRTGTNLDTYYPRMPISRPIWPFLLSFQGGATGPKDSITVPYPIQIEVDDGTGWTVGIAQTPEQAWDNGIIYLGDSMRELLLATEPTDRTRSIFRWTSGTPYDKDATKLLVSVNDFRATVALRTDYRLGAAVRLGSDDATLADSTLSPFEVTKDCPDAARFETGYSRTLVLDLHELYELWLRYNSYPEPESAGGTKFDDRLLTNPLRNDLALMQSHVRRVIKDRFRLGRDGGLAMDGTLAPLYPPGTQINNLVPKGDATRKPFPIRCVVRRRRWTTDVVTDDNGNTSIENKVVMVPS